MFGHHAGEFLRQLIAFVFEFVERAAPLFGDIGGEFDAVQAEVRAAQQAEFVADQQDVAEEGLDFALHGGDKGGNRAVVWGEAVGQGDEEDVFAASLFDLAGTDHAFGVSQQDDLEQDFGMDGGSAGLVVVVAGVEDREVKAFFDQFADGVFERAGDNLVLQGNGQHDQLIFIAGFEFCHKVLFPIKPYGFKLDSPLFRQFQRLALLAGGRDEIKLQKQDSVRA